MKTRDRIWITSIDMFNKNGVVAVTTNHIAKDLGISPGNLYFHFENKEEIIRHIFVQMNKEMYKIWRTTKSARLVHPLELMDKNFELFWKYRFFHREMYYLKRKDPELSKMWKTHIAKMLKVITVMYKRWMREGWMLQIKDPNEIHFLVNVLLATASAFLQFFESAEKQPGKMHIETGKRYVARLILHYTQGKMRQDFDNYVQSAIGAS